MSHLLLEYRNNKTAHEDMYFHLGDYSSIGDSYYFDLEIEKRQGANSSIENILIELLTSWIEAIRGADATRPLYLPYDFGDQYTRCLKCSLDSDRVEIECGWSAREGYSVSPSNPQDFFYTVEDFKAESPAPIQLSKERIVLLIEESIAHAQKQLTLN